jgi:integrase
MERDTPAPRLLDQVRTQVRVRHYSYRTEVTYVGWIRRFILFHGKRHPRLLGKGDIERFLSDLAVRRRVSASTQSQALAAVLFLYKQVLKIELPWLDEVVRASKPRHLPVVLTAAEAQAVIAQLSGELWLIGSLLYGSGLRVLEALRLRVKDIDFDYSQIRVRDGKGAKDRVTVLPESLVRPLQVHLQRVRERYESSDVETTQIYTHVMQKGAGAVRSPLDRLQVKRDR